MFKKIILIMLLMLLVGCDNTVLEDDVTIDCEVFPKHEDCEVDPNNDVNPIVADGEYENKGKTSDIIYIGRDIVSADCNHLENIGEWQPVWCDEFNYEGLPDSNKWTYDVGGHGWGNGEAQYYTSEDLDNSFVANGVLTIRAIKEDYLGSEYTSTRLITKNTGDWLYGKIQVRAKLPSGRGTWPAIWMLPTDWKYGNWPDSGEIDIMEHVGYDQGNIHSTLHSMKHNHMIGTQIGYSIFSNTVSTEFHVYEIEWEPGKLTTYMDGLEYASFNFDALDNINLDTFVAWPFDQEFHLLLNIAVGGGWGGVQGIDDSIFPQEMVIDYVRVYQKDYAGMDESAPSPITNLVLNSAKKDSLHFTWTAAVDDVMIENYEIYVDDVLTKRTSLTGFYLEGLDSFNDYDIKIIAVDYAGNESTPVIGTYTTLSPPEIFVEAEDYFDMSGIQTEVTQDAGGGRNVGYIDTGDWLEYSLVVTDSGDYQIDFRYSSQSNGLHIAFYSDQNLLFHQNADATGGWQTWATTTSQTVHLQAGTYTFKILAENSGFNLNYFEFRKVN